eukprot:65312_1
MSIFDNKNCSKPTHILREVADNWFVHFLTEEECVKTAMYLQFNGKFKGNKLKVRVKSVIHPLAKMTPIQRTTQKKPLFSFAQLSKMDLNCLHMSHYLSALNLNEFKQYIVNSFLSHTIQRDQLIPIDIIHICCKYSEDHEFIMCQMRLHMIMHKASNNLPIIKQLTGNHRRGYYKISDDKIKIFEKVTTKKPIDIVGSNKTHKNIKITVIKDLHLHGLQKIRFQQGIMGGNIYIQCNNLYLHGGSAIIVGPADKCSRNGLKNSIRSNEMQWDEGYGNLYVNVEGNITMTRSSYLEAGHVEIRCNCLQMEQRAYIKSHCNGINIICKNDVKILDAANIHSYNFPIHVESSNKSEVTITRNECKYKYKSHIYQMAPSIKLGSNCNNVPKTLLVKLPQQYQQYYHSHCNNASSKSVLSRYMDLTDTENVRQFRKMAEPINTKQFIDSSYLMTHSNSSRKHLQKTDNNKPENTIESQCTASKCPNLKRLQKALKVYHEFIENQKPQPVAVHQQHPDAAHNEMLIINDFHHLLDLHNHEFEEIYNILVEQCFNRKKCVLSDCLMMKRNHRDRRRLRVNNKELNKMYCHQTDVIDIVHQQIMDSIHCHYFHSFDIGYKLSNQQKLEIKKMVMKESTENEIENKLIHDKSARSIYEYVNKIQQFTCSNSTKFVNAFENADLKYSFGVKFFYWKYYKMCTAKQWDPALYDPLAHMECANEGYSLSEFYVEAKYIDLKTELFTNTICSISLQQWDNYAQKANCLLGTDHIKSTQCHKRQRFDLKLYYNLTVGSTVSFGHIVAIMIHCNENLLQNKFNATYRRIPKNETNQSLIERHRNYAQMGRLLKELVDGFGHCEPRGYQKGWGFTKFTKYAPYLRSRLYHGTTIKSQFPSTDVCVNGPLSTTTDFSVAVNFSGAGGLILELYPNHGGRVAHGMGFFYDTGLISCTYYSDFSNEQEIFFIGGVRRLSIFSIITPLGANYKYFVRALATINNYLYQSSTQRAYFSSRMIDQDRNEFEIIQKLSFRMILDELHRHYPEKKEYVKFESIPSYARCLLQHQFRNVTGFLQGHVPKENDKLHHGQQFYLRLFRNLFYYDYGWIKLKLLTKLFPSIRRIELAVEQKNCDTFIESTSVYISVVSLVETSLDLKLQYISIKLPENYKEKAINTLNQFRQRFTSNKWTVNWKRQYNKIIMTSFDRKRVMGK